MVSTSSRPDQLGTRWPPDDTEESVVGTDWHQLTITNLRLGINEIAQAEAGSGQPVPWQALSQTMITGFRRPDGTRYTTLPDVFIYRKPIARNRLSLSLLRDGPPVLVIEVASDSTYEADLDLATGKGWTYAHAGVQEYLAMDPTGMYLPEPLCGWRLVNGQFQESELDSDGLWWSAGLPLGFGVADGLVAVYNQAHEIQPREGEITARLASERVELARVRAELENAQADLARKDAETAELRRRLHELER
jgi:Putative restriction endonuclease